MKNSITRLLVAVLRRTPMHSALVLILAAMVLPFQSRGQTTLTNGANQSATLAVGASDSYTITASAADRIAIQVAKLSGGAGFTPRIDLFAPDGTRLETRSDALVARIDLQAPDSGTYTLTVSDLTGTGAGNYTVRTAQIPGSFTVPAGDDGGPLTNGAIHLGTIDVGDFDMWTISAGAGDRLTFQIAELTGGAGFTPMIEVFGPDGTSAGTGSGGVAARVDVQADQAGLYTVLVSDANRTGTGTYQLELAQVPGNFVVTTNDEGGALADATDTNGAISLGDLDMWSFTGTPGDHVLVQLTKLTGGAGFTPLIELFTPTGQRKAVAQDASSPAVDVAIETAGTYTVLVSDANQTGAGTYRLHLTRDSIAPAGANVLINGSTSLAGITVAGETNFWTFTASAGESFVVRMGEITQAAFIPWIRIYGPTGVLLGQNFSAVAAEVTARATNSGTFMVVVSDGTAAKNQTGNYRISLAKTGSPLAISASDEGGALINGTTYLAAIDAGDIDAWTFTADSGQTMVVRVGEVTAGSTLLPWVRLYGPDGALIGSNFSAAAAEVTARATNSGTFLVVVGDGNNGFGGVGNYRISLAKTGGQPVISSTDEGGPMVNGTTYLGTIDTGDIDAWTFTANAGESVVVRIGETTVNSTLLPWLRLYGPNGALLDSGFSAVAAEVTARATNSGTFMVVVGDGNNGFGGIGGYRLSLAKTGGQPVISSTDEGGPMVNGTTYLGTIDTGDIDAWTFTADAGDSVIVRMGEVTASSPLLPWLRLYGPDGTLIDSGFSAAAAEVTARVTNSGTFLVVAADGNNGFGGTGNYRISLARSGSQPVISPNDEGGPLVNGTTYLATIDTGDIDAWTFNATAGQSIVVRMGETTASSGLLPWLRLYGPNGALLSQGFSAAVAEVSAKATNSGIFMVVASDGNNGNGGSGNYRISLAQTGEPLFISPGDEGGAMTGAGSYEGTIDTGDIDSWTFTACAGDVISMNVTELVTGSSLTPWLRFYGRDGTLLKSVFGAATAGFTDFIAPASGTYLVVISDGSNGSGGTGTYNLTVNGLADGLKFCIPSVSPPNGTVLGIGGVAGVGFSLLSTTNVATPLALWPAILTNQFDQFGSVTVTTNLFDPRDPQRFFIIRIP